MSHDEPTHTPLRDARAAWRKWTRSSAKPDLNIGIVSSFTADALAPYLGCALLSRGWSPLIQLAPFNQLFQTLSSPRMAFGGASPETLLLLPRLDELAADELSQYSGGDSAAWAEAQSKISELANALARLRQSWTGTTIAGTFPPPTTPEFDLLHIDRLGVLFYEKAAAFWQDMVAGVKGVHLLDVRAIAIDLGLRNTFDPRLWYLYRQPFSEEFFFELGAVAARLIDATRRSSAKCAVIDCDNTLWGGIVGEDGLDGIRLGDEFPGSAYRGFQRLLLHWRRQGVLLAVCSRNNSEDVRKVFREHRAMLLRESDISAWAVDWRPKSEQLAGIAKDLNIGTDALVFFDDNAYEIGEVLSRHPKLRCIQIPSAPESIAAIARRSMPFDRLEITAEDRSRARSYAIEAQRDELRNSLPLDDFIASLNLQVETVAAGPDNLTRIAQLINKTNQFNLTGIRLTQDEVGRMAQSGDHVVRAAVVRDRFGEYGLTCAAILERRGRDWHILIFLLSCRVLGRGVETRFLGDLAEEVFSRGGDRITAEFTRTDRNAVAADFLESHGFTKPESGLCWRSAAELAPARLAKRT
ncbi:MAG: HAD-IIIC family phosphatase [Terriglobia bacterium]